jgi:hypothetical protein
MKMKLIKFPVIAILILTGFSECKKDKIQDGAVADVFVKSVLLDGEPVFGLSHYVAGYTPISSAIVSTPGGLTDQLSPYDASYMTFYLEPTIGLGTYSTTPPAPGTYSYGVTFKDGVEKVVTNVLGDTYLLPPAISSITKLADNANVRLTWAAVVGVDYYQLSILKDGSFVYTSPVFTPPTVNFIDIPISWIPSFTPAMYTYELDAIKYEAVGSSSLQSISSATIPIDL